jgi:phage gp36-like protein
MSYITQSNIEDVFGVNNIVRWSNVDNDNETVDATRIARSILIADDFIDDHFRNSQYKVPFTTVPRKIVDWAAKWAGIWLYESRGLADDNEEGNKLQKMKEKTEQEISECLAGMIKLNAVRVDATVPTAPFIMEM